MLICSALQKEWHPEGGLNANVKAMSSRVEALVVGAGPVGLSTAAFLAAQGLRCRVIDSAAGPVKESRAIGIQARTLEVLEMQGVAGEFLELGHRLHGVTPIIGFSWPLVRRKTNHTTMGRAPYRQPTLF